MIRGVIGKIQYENKLKKFRRLWREENKNNRTIAVREFPLEQVKVGSGTYGELDVLIYDNCTAKLKIGSYCSIAKGVTFLLGGEHCYKRLMSYPVDKMVLGKENAEYQVTGDTVIGDDVWIGYGATILSGVNIGQGAIVGAGTVVAKDVPPYAIYASGRIIKYRFSQEIIEKLIKMDFSKITEDEIKKHAELFGKNITTEILDSPEYRKFYKERE